MRAVSSTQRISFLEFTASVSNSALARDFHHLFLKLKLLLLMIS